MGLGLSLENGREAQWNLVSKVQDGDADAFLELTAWYLPLIRKKAAEFPTLELEDSCQEGLLGLFSAARSYSPENRAGFRTYAEVCIVNRLRSALRAQAAEKRIPPCDLVSLDDDQNHTAFDLALQDDSDPESLLIARERFETVRNQIGQSLTKLERDVFFFYLNGYGYSEISEKLHLSGKSVDNAIQRVRQKMKRLLSF